MEKEKNIKIIKNTIMTLIMLIVLAIASIFINKPVEAMVSWNGSTTGGRPSFSISNATGLFPQLISQRGVTAQLERFNLTTSNTSNWYAAIGGSTVYCQDQGTILRNGKIDYNTYYTNLGVSYNDMVQVVKNMVKIGHDGDRSWNVSLQGNINTSEKMYLNNASASNLAQARIADIQGMLAGEEKPTAYSPDVDSVKTYGNWSGDPVYGPQVCVMETSNGAQNGYTLSKSGTYNSSNKGKDASAAYILTVLENMYSGEYSKKYNEEDIQTAYWMLMDDTGYKESKLTENGKKLYNKSLEYEKFLNETANGYNTSIDNSNAKIVSNRNAQEYIVGPFKANYSDYTDISYIKSMYITTNTGKQLVIDEQNQDFTLILASGGTTGSNGITKTYPKSGENFFIKFSAEKAGYPDYIDVNANFEYISNSTINYNELRSKANIYRYYGHCEYSGKYAMNLGTINVSCTVKWREKIHDSYTDSLGNYHSASYEDRSETYYSGVKQLIQPYVKMDTVPESTDTAQPLVVSLDGSRQYTVVHNSVGKTLEQAGTPSSTPSKDYPVDITMELGGIVWEDNTGGKETIGNNIKDSSDKVMPNVVVNIYRADGTYIATTKTDSNGKYKFSKLNAMYQYYIKFTYNGQYYQPVTYAPSSTWGSTEWPTNSNGTDTKTQRTSYNAKFASIGSSPENYNGSAGANETFTQKELLGYTLQDNGEYSKTREAVIDEFGNLILESSSDSTTQKMIQYVKDCQMDSYTGNGSGSYDLYPVPAIFVIDKDVPLNKELLGLKIAKLYDTAYYINQGYVQREKSDLTLKKDIEKVTLEINGQTHTYTYDTIENAANNNETWDINVRLSDAYYNTNYSREIYTSDYLYKASDYGQNYESYGKSKTNELQVYVTYKLMVYNQSQSIRCKVDEIVDYYDNDYTYVDNRSYIKIAYGENKGIYDVKASDTSRYSSSTKTTIDGYDNLYVTGLDNMYLTSGQVAYVYLTFNVKKDNIENEDWVRLDEEVETAVAKGVGKENIAEINGYSTLYKDNTVIPNVGTTNGNTVAGIVDRDSNSGNLKASDVPKDGNINYKKFEDDTDKAPDIRLLLNRDDNSNRVISGTVWEDERNESIGVTTTGDGIRDNNETAINGATVQLVELNDNGTEFVWRTFENGSGTADKTAPIIDKYNIVKDYTFESEHNGDYAFKSFIPGKYVIRFIYGDTVKTVLTSDSGTNVNKTLEQTGLNAKSYNGQDYKSTTYQEGITQNKTYTWRKASSWTQGQETLGEIIRNIATYDKTACTQNEILTYLYDITESSKITNVSDAKDIQTDNNRLDSDKQLVNSREEVENYSKDSVTNHIAEVLVSDRELPTYPDGSYNKTQLESLINELMDRTKMTAETGTMVVEFEYDRTGTADQTVNNASSYQITNVDLGLEERPKAQLEIEKEVTNVKLTLADGSILFDAQAKATNVLWRDHKDYDLSYKGNVLDTNKFGNIVNIRNQNASKFGLIQLSMDEELMHGATIKITYKVTVSNVGEADYKDNRFYYTGNVSDTNTIVTTKANQVIDYVANNLQFYAADNSNWKVITKEDLLSQGLVNTGLTKQLDQYNTVIITDSLGTDLVPEIYKEKIEKNAVDSVEVPLILTQLITSENETDDLTYRNIVEIVKTSNTVGRKNEYSVVGNQDPTKDPQELDSDKAEIVKILPPFGDTGMYYIIAAIIAGVAVIVTGGIIFIKKKVLRK